MEPSPKGFGNCAHCMDVGDVLLGTDDNRWEVNVDRNGRKYWKMIWEDHEDHDHDHDHDVYEYRRPTTHAIADCPPGKIVNPSTNRCVSETGKIGRQLLWAPRPPVTTMTMMTDDDCPPGKIINPPTNRCVSETGKIGRQLLWAPRPPVTTMTMMTDDDCPPGKIINPPTNRCVSETGKIGRELLWAPRPPMSMVPIRPIPVPGYPRDDAFRPMLAEKLKPRMDPVGMWVSEKLDGVRAIFRNGRFYSRGGNVFAVPAWFVRAMPKNAVLDGELYTKRGDFQRIMSIVKKNPPNEAEWRTIKFMVFDMPVPNVPFETRYANLRRIVNQTPPTKHLVLVKNELVKSRTHLAALHQQIIAKGGEGLMLRRPGSLYEHRRTNSLLKLKKDDDDEAVVVGHEYGRGKNARHLGKLVVKWRHSKELFRVGSGFTDRQRRDYKRLYPVGTIVKIKYNGLTGSNKPRFPVFLGRRDAMDMS